MKVCAAACIPCPLLSVPFYFTIATSKEKSIPRAYKPLAVRLDPRKHFDTSRNRVEMAKTERGDILHSVYFVQPCKLLMLGGKKLKYPVRFMLYFTSGILDAVICEAR